jgi:hypothetical protein
MEQFFKEEYLPEHATEQLLDTEAESDQYSDSEGLVSGLPKNSRKHSHLHRIYSHATQLLITILLIIVSVETVVLNQVNGKSRQCFLTSSKSAASS